MKHALRKQLFSLPLGCSAPTLNLQTLYVSICVCVPRHTGTLGEPMVFQTKICGAQLVLSD